MSYKMDIVVQGCPESLNKVLRMHYIKRNAYNQRWHHIIDLSTLGMKPPEPLMKAKLTLVRNAYRSLDYDNCVSSMKPIVDGLVRAFIIKDDKWPVTGPWVVDQVFAKKDKDFIRIIVEERA